MSTEETYLLDKSLNKGDEDHHHQYKQHQHQQQQLPRLYGRRWYILFVFSIFSATQSNMWITYGAVADTAKHYYHVSGASINLLTSMGPIAYLCVATVSSWAIGEYGLRKTVLVAAGMTAFSSVSRCFATQHSFWIVIVSQFINALGGPVVMTIPPSISASWFGVNERTFATAVGSMFNFLGSSVGFLLGLAVHDDRTLYILLLAEAGFAVAIATLIAIYFPDSPPTPPTATAVAESECRKNQRKKTLHESWIAVFSDSWKVLKQKDSLLMILAGGSTPGVYSGWTAMIVLILMPLGYSQDQAQWLGLTNSLIGVGGGLVVGWIHDRYKNFKILLMILFLSSGLVFAVFSVATEGIWKHINFAELLTISCAGGLLLNAMYPITYEALVEISYPVSEEIGSGLLALWNNVCGLIFLIVGDYINPGVMNWLLVGTTVLSFFIMIPVKEMYKRTNVDLFKPVLSVS